MPFQYTDDGHIIAEQNGRKALDTRAPMLGLVPAGAIVKEKYGIYFPDFWRGVYYRQYSVSTGGIPASTIHGCSTWVALVEQEWGPEAPAPNTMPDGLLGTVPPGTDYLEVWVNLTRIFTPNLLLDLPIYSNFPDGTGVWVKLDGLSCVLEEFMGVARQIEFVLDGTNVYLRRRQSVNKEGGVLPGYYRSQGPGAANAGYFYEGVNAPIDPSKMLTFGQKIDEKASRDNPAHRAPGKEDGFQNNDPCSAIPPSWWSYASTWEGDIIIKPGFI